MATIEVYLQDEKIEKLEYDKSFLLASFRSLEEKINRGEEIDPLGVAVWIKQLRGQVESGEIHRRNITPGLVRE